MEVQRVSDSHMVDAIKSLAQCNDLVSIRMTTPRGSITWGAIDSVRDHAPELLAALEEIAERVRYHMDCVGVSDYDPMWKAYDQAQAAIAKAKA